MVLDVSDDLAAGDEDVGRFMGAQGVDLSGGYVPDLTPATISVSFLSYPQVPSQPQADAQTRYINCTCHQNVIGSLPHRREQIRCCIAMVISNRITSSDPHTRCYRRSNLQVPEAVRREAAVQLL